MRTALGFKTHSGWAAMVAVGSADGRVRVVDRRRIELVEETWAKQPYHAAERLPIAEARALVTRGIAAARVVAARELRNVIAELGDVAGCAVVVGQPMPEWSVDEILAVHFRMHKAEGLLFQDVLLRAADDCGLVGLGIREKELGSVQVRAVGPPWGSDQKAAAAAAMFALRRLGGGG
ncbi:MAG: hypothetical protein HYX27_03285 [Acidobacteria bacterium]|nr:hypothetical protein [Acidobacteriota bacterium]